MLSKLLPPGVMEKHLTHEHSKRKEISCTQDSIKKPNLTNDVSASKSSVNPSCLNSNWEKFRNVVSQQEATQKQPKHQNSRSNKKRRFNQTSRMVLPQTHSGRNGETNIFSIGDESKLNKELTRQIAMDCEMVGIGDGTESMLARVSLVNRHGACVYDKYVKPREKIEDYRTAVSGIRPHHVENGEDFKIVQSEVSQILSGRLLIGHSLRNDLNVLFLSHPHRNLRDTSRYKPFRKIVNGNTPSLKKLAAELLGVAIQSGEHNSIEDARTAMQLYVLYKKQWEKDIFSRS